MPTYSNLSNLSKMYHLLLENGSGVLSPNIQRKICDYALSSRDTALLKKLAEYPGLTKEVDNILGRENDLAILVAWASRKDRDVADLEKRLLKEKRVNALLPLASVTGLDQKVYSTVARIDSIHLTGALAGNPSVADDLRKRKLVEYAKRLPRGGSNPHVATLKKMVENGSSPESQASFYEAIAMTSNVAPYLEACLNSKVISSAAIDSILERIPVIYEMSGSSLDRHTAKFFHVLATVQLNPTQHKSLLAGMEKIVDSVKSSWRVRPYQDILETIKYSDAEYDAVYERFVSCQDADESALLLDELKHRVASRGAGSSQSASIRHNEMARMVRAVASHRYLPVDKTLAYTSEMTESELQDLLARMEAGNDMESMVALLDAVRVPERVLYGACDPHALVKAYVAKRESKGFPNPLWLASCGPMVKDANLAYASLSYEHLLVCMGRNLELRAMVAAEMEKHLVSQEMWEVFHSLAKDFTGKLSQLLSVSVNIR